MLQNREWRGSVLLLIVVYLLVLLNTDCYGQTLTQISGSGAIPYVNTFIGSGGEGFGIGSVPVGPQFPYGMVRLTPDTCLLENIFIPFNHFGGYYYGDDHIRCFSHTHMDGSGVVDFGNIAVMPATSSSPLPSFSLLTNYGFRSAFDHSSENSHPGYYSVYLSAWDVTAELTATARTGAQRFTFTNKQYPIIVFPISHTLSPGACQDALISIDRVSGEVSGYIWNSGAYSSRVGGVKTYFVARLNTTTSNWAAFGVFNSSGVYPSTSTIRGCPSSEVGGYITLQPSATVSVELYFGISFVSISNARMNLMNETKSLGYNFDALHNISLAAWVDHLSTISITASLPEQTNDVVKFYSNLYHTALGPTTYSDVNGEYITFSTPAAPAPPHTSFLPRNQNLFMSNIIIADAYLKNITNFNLTLAYKAMIQSATTPQNHAGRDDFPDWVNKGYVAYDVAGGDACCDTLAYSYDDWAISNIAQVLKDSYHFQLFRNRSQNYRNEFNSGYFCPRNKDGSWACPEWWDYENPFSSKYVEGDAWQYRFFVPHDPEGLISLFTAYGGESYFVDELTLLFERSTYDPLNILPNPYYWAGNEPSLFCGWEFVFAGRADLTQKYIRMIMETRYLNTPDGLPGNDDYGTMSAWFVFSALGFYPQSGHPVYVMGSPLFQQMEIRSSSVGGGLKIVAHDASQQNIYVQKVLVNGVQSTVPFFDHADLFRKGGGTLEFFMGPQPASNGGFPTPLQNGQYNAFAQHSIHNAGRLYNKNL